jgi:hypothetical protein
MFVQHQITNRSKLEPVALPTDDFELYVQEKSQQKIAGKIQFKYLNQTFNASIIITAHTIQIEAQQAFSGIKLNAPIISTNEF